MIKKHSALLDIHMDEIRALKDLYDKKENIPLTDLCDKNTHSVL